MNDNLTQNSQNIMNALGYGLASHRNAWRLEQYETYGDIKSLRNQLDLCQNAYITNLIKVFILIFIVSMTFIAIGAVHR